MSDTLYVYGTIAASPAIYLFCYSIARPAPPPICLSEVVKQALRLIARIPLIQRREKSPSREEKSAFT